MAQRFGGRYSPGGNPTPPASPGGSGPGRRGNGYAGRKPSRAGARVNFLFIVPLPMLLFAFWQDQVGLALNFAGYAVIAFAAWMTREGLIAQDAYEARRVARRPALPRKIIGAVAMGLGVAVGAVANQHGLPGAVILGAIAGALHLAAFGLDPLTDKVAEGVDSFQTDRVARVVDDAEEVLTAMRDHARRSNDRRILARVDAFLAEARELIRTVENDPRRLTAARRYLGVYLVGARDATDKFTELFLRTGDLQARLDYESLLDDLQTSFRKQTEALLTDDRTALDIEMGVLRDRLEREGVRTE